MYARLLYLPAVIAGLLAGAPVQQLLALAVVVVLVTRRALIVHASHHPARR
jgi:hypothetical protein